MKHPLISVIVPIYRIEHYVGICIESILEQTYKNLEIILVDDGGKDRSPEICDLYASKDSRIKVIHKSNGGLVSARKAGMLESNGRYISYVDGDDWIGPGFIEGLYNAIETADAEIACAGHCRDLFNQSEYFTNAFPAGVYHDKKLEELWKSMISRGEFYRPGITTYVWSKLFRRETVLPVQMAVDDHITIGEDAAVTYPALLNAKRIVVTENAAYHYRQREDSMLKQNSSYADEAVKLRILYEYLIGWAEHTADRKGRKGWKGRKGLSAQIVDYVLSIAIMRSGGRLPQNSYSAFDRSYYGKDVIIFSAGTFGQQLANRFRETAHCNLVSWIDDDYREYRRCCLDVDPVESITGTVYDYILIATVDRFVAEKISARLWDLGVSRDRILTVTVPEKELERKELLEQFLNMEALGAGPHNGEQEVYSHA